MQPVGTGAVLDGTDTAGRLTPYTTRLPCTLPKVTMHLTGKRTRPE